MLSLPWEVKFMILDQLPPLSRVALALTAKPLITVLYPTGRVPILGHHPGRTVFPLPSHSELSERDELLLLLERDDPTLAFCFDCRRLCKFDSGRGHLSCAEPATVKYHSYSLSEEGAAKHPPLLEEAHGWAYEREVKAHPLAWMPEIKWPVVPFAEARLVMNRHFYGEPYGLPLSSLEYRYEFERFIDLHKETLDSHFPLGRHPQDRQYLTRQRQYEVWNSHTANADIPTHPWKFKHVSEAKIIKNELYLARFHSINGPLVDRRDFIKLLNSLELPICRHARFHQYSPSLTSCPHRGKSRAPTEFRCILQCKSSAVRRSWSCIDCYTDYSISIWKDELMGWNCELSTYHRLGKCRSPFDPIWKLIIWSSFDEPSIMCFRSPQRIIRDNREVYDTFSVRPYGGIIDARFCGIAYKIRHETWRPGVVKWQWQQSNGEAGDLQESAWIHQIGSTCGGESCKAILMMNRYLWEESRQGPGVEPEDYYQLM